MENMHDNQKSGSSLIFLGTGSSGGCPTLLCLLQPSNPPCEVCHKAIESPPEVNRNYRCNSSLLIDYEHDGEHNFILIDVGKNFKEQVIRWFLRYKIPRVDAIVLTHDHADAILGLDDVRDVQKRSHEHGSKQIPIFLNQFTMDSVATRFPYLVPNISKKDQVGRRVSKIDWNIFESSCKTPFHVAGLQFTPLPVKHGEDYISLGFLFGNKSRVAYISDVSSFLDDSEYVISKSGGGQVDLLILDSLTKKEASLVHYNLTQSLEAVKRIQPKRSLFIGMSDSFEHYRDNQELAEWSKREGIDVQLAYDGLRVLIDL